MENLGHYMCTILNNVLLQWGVTADGHSLIEQLEIGQYHRWNMRIISHPVWIKSSKTIDAAKEQLATIAFVG